jgi:hypothetical protein
MIEAEVVHHIAGRMRVRVPAAKRDAELLQEIRNSVKEVPAVLDVSANAALGTLVIQYDPALFGEMVQRVAEHVSKAALFVLRPADVEPEYQATSELNRAVDRYFSKLNRIVQAATGRAVNLNELFPFGILLYSMLLVDRALAASQWLSWVQFALSTYLELHGREPINQVGESVAALRTEVQGLRAELQTYFANQKNA